MNINVNSIVKALQNEQLQQFGGYYLYASKEFHDGALDGSLRMLDALIKDPHIPNLSHVANNLRQSGIIKDLVKLGLGGWIAEMVKIHPKLTQMGKIAKNFAVNGGIGAAVGSAILHSSLSHSPASNSSGGGSSDGWRSS